MLDLFTIFSKGGIVLWCCQSVNQTLTSSVNALIKSVILQERGGLEAFTHDALSLKYHLDNEFELVFVIGYQKFLQLSYVDKFLSDIQLEFRDRYKTDLQQRNICRDFADFTPIYQSMLRDAENSSRLEAKNPKPMKKWEDSTKSQKTVASMIERKEETKSNKMSAASKADKSKSEKPAKTVSQPSQSNGKVKNIDPDPQLTSIQDKGSKGDTAGSGGDLDEETIRQNRERLMNKMNKCNEPSKRSPNADSLNGGGTEKKKKGKENTVWGLSDKRKPDQNLDYSSEKDKQKDLESYQETVTEEQQKWVGQASGQIHNLDLGSSDEEEEENEKPASGKKTVNQSAAKSKNNSTTSEKKGGRFGLFSGLSSLVGSRTLSMADIQPALEKMKDHLIMKNVASEVAESLCKSVATKLEGKILGTFNSVATTVKQALNEACVQLLEPRKRVDILRDALDAKQRKTPYVVTFCGVNGVGKSTNLAKVCFWLIENGLRVLIAACDTFRAGAVEQLRTHVRKLNALHPAEMHDGLQMVQLYEKGYGKDPAGIAMEAIRYARDHRIDVVLVDTAGRMQDNEPLMIALAKLIKVNEPDLVLFVGEALVGNEAVDQLVKFNQALADHSSKDRPHLIDGIVLTKFDTIDDKVGAAISMTYITGQPIMFVGTGQTYVDLKNLNAKSVVHALLKN